MKRKISRSLYLQVGLFIFVASIISFIFTQMISQVKASELETDTITSAECEQEYGRDHVKYDLLSGGLEEEYLSHGQDEGVQSMNAAVSDHNTCNSISLSHGPGRENGYSANFLSTGCGNWKGYSYTYGTTNIPFYIETATMTTARRDDIRAQAALWNEAVMHDGTGQIINLYEVNSTNNINGRYVARVRQENITTAGSFNVQNNIPTIRLNQYMAVDTPAHEFGHLLGLDDLDESIIADHYTLMGYLRNTVTTPFSNAIRYQEIQGIAVINGRHTTHHFNRYIKNGNNYLHFCFYCDIVDTRPSIISGSSQMAIALSCVHDYQQMVSAGERHWFKCTACYKVVESEFYIKSISNGGNITLELTGLINTNKTSISIPRQIGGQEVTHIGNLAFAAHNLTSITIPNIIMRIGDYAFLDCNNLTIYAESVIRPAGWSSLWNHSNRPVVWGCNLSLIGNTYSITYLDSGGATFSGIHGAGYPTSHTYGTVTTLVKPKKTGYAFYGWYTDSSCSGSPLTQLSATGYTGNITLYALWGRPSPPSGYDIYGVDDWISVYEFFSKPSFIITSPYGGMYMFDVYLRGCGSVSVFIFDVSSNTIEELCYVENADGVVYGSIYLEADFYYLIEIGTDDSILAGYVFDCWKI